MHHGQRQTKTRELEQTNHRVIQQTIKVRVYKIPYRRTRAWPSGCFRPGPHASKGIFNITYN